MSTVGPHALRETLRRYPTGVCVVAGPGPESDRSPLTVGSFAAISLDPELVGFFVGHASTSWPRIRPAGRFCVSVLSERQAAVAAAMSSQRPDKASATSWISTPGGGVAVQACVAWFDCDLQSSITLGDHDLVVGLVRAHGRLVAGDPLLFYNGKMHGPAALGADERQIRTATTPVGFCPDEQFPMLVAI